jgi:type III secretion protein J
MVRLVTAVCALLVLAGCRTEIYSKLDESDANDMLVVLRNANIDATKELADGGKAWRVTVSEEKVVQAMNVLRDSGLPKKPHANLGELFKKDGMVSSPVEDKVRFLHGLSQELSETLSRIDGVMTARVHIVLPENDPRGKLQLPSSASVFMKFHPSVNLGPIIPSIRQLVARSIEGLDPERVSVTLVPAQVAMVEVTEKAPEGHPWWWLMLAFVLLSVTAAGGGYAYHHHTVGGTDLKWPDLGASSNKTKVA